MRCAQILFGFKQCYLTHRIGTFQLTRITLEILTTIRIKKIQDSMFVTCSCAVLGVFVGHCYWGGFEFYACCSRRRNERKNMYPAPFWTWTGLKRQILPFATVIPPAGSSDMEPQKLRKPH